MHFKDKLSGNKLNTIEQILCGHLYKTLRLAKFTETQEVENSYGGWGQVGMHTEGSMCGVSEYRKMKRWW